MLTEPVAVVLAAGKSTRMKSAVPKVLHLVSGRPMIEWVLDAARTAGVKRILVVVGHQAERVQHALAGHNDVEFVMQTEQLGTGHAVMVCQPALDEHQGAVLILAGDTPLLRAESLKGLLDALTVDNAACVVGTATTAANAGLGRILRNADGEFQRIVEHKDATPEQREIQEINTGCYAFQGPRLKEALERIQPDNSQAEYYLTDCPALLSADGHRVLAAEKLDIHEAMGVNTREQLADVERAMQTRWQRQLMDSGVSIVAPELTYIDLRATIGAETVIHPFTSVVGAVSIGEHCQLGPHSHIGPGAVVADGTTIGAFERVP